MTIELTEQQWLQVFNLMAFGPYREVQPLLDAMSKQLLVQKQGDSK